MNPARPLPARVLPLVAPAGIGDFLDVLAPVLSETSLDQVLDSGLNLLIRIGDAASAGLILVQKNQVAREVWAGDTVLQDNFRAEMHRLALEAVQSPAPFDPAPIRVSDSLFLRLYPFSTGDHPLGVVCLAWPSGAEDRSTATSEVIRNTTRLLAQRTSLQLEVQASRRKEAQNERWFKRLDEQLRVLDRERQKFASMVSQTDTDVFVADAEGRISWVNKAMSARLAAGGSFVQSIGKSCREVFAELFGDPCGLKEDDPCPVARALATNGAVHEEMSVMRDGVVRNLYLTALPIKGPDGRAQEVIVTIQDLSDLAVIRRSEARYRTLFDKSSNAIVMIDPVTTEVVLANSMATRMLGYSGEQLLGLPLSELHPPEEWERVSGEYERLMAGSPSRVDGTLVTRGGGRRMAEVSATRFEHDGRDLVMMEFTDVTERRHAELALQAAEERLHTVVANSPLVLFALDREGRFTLSEGKGLQNMGLAPGEVLGRSVYELYADVPSVLEDISRAFGGEEFVDVVTVGPLVFETWFAPLRDAAGGVAGVLGVATDVTASKRLEDQLRQSQKMEAVGRLAGGVAHDFNNLLTVILGHCEFMMNRAEPGSALFKDAEAVHKAGIRGSLLARQLLAFSRKEVLEPRELDVNTVLSEIDGMLRRLVGEDIEFITVTTPSEVFVRADQGQLEQVVMNLVVNSRDAMPGGGKLTIEVSPVEIDGNYALDHITTAPGSYVMIAVSDTGVGMTPDTCLHLFEPFFTTKERGKGTGLGLSIVYGIIRGSGGDVQVYSEPDSGTTIKVYLPRIARAIADAPSGETPAAEPAGSEVVLLTEDEAEVRSLARDILEMNGYSVLEATCGDEAIRIATAHPGRIHLLLSDVVMPGMSGGELARRLTAMRGDLRVLFMSGYPDDAIVRHGVLGPEMAFIQKPFTLDALARKVRDTIDADSPGAESGSPKAA